MPKGMRNGSNELAKAYVHGRIDATRDLLTNKINKKLHRELNHWCYRFSLNPVELEQELGAVSVTPQINSLPSSGVQYATGQREGHGMATVEVVERAHGVRSSLGPGNAASQVAPDQVGAQPAKEGMKKYWASLTPKQVAAVMRDKLLATSKKRMLAPMEKKRLETFTAKAGNTVAPKGGKAAAKEAAKSKQKTTPDEKRVKQQFYAARSVAKKKGLPMPPLPPKVAA